VSEERSTLHFVARPRVIERRVSRFLREPISVRSAANVIVVVTALVVVLGGVLMRALDGDEYPNVWKGMWWALQTVTTVGYGDVTPTETSGRIVAAFIMLEGVAFLSIVVAAITSIFVARAQREREAETTAKADGGPPAIDRRFDDLEVRLDRLEAMISRLADS
jgi:voltage-gated potassium channel